MTKTSIPKEVTRHQFSHRLLRILEWPLGRFSQMGDHTFFDPQAFPWTHLLESNWQLIRRELDVVLAEEQIPSFQNISPSQSALTTDHRWKTYFLYGYGYKVDKNCEKCPETTRLIEQVPGMTTAFFSILAPHKHIPAHRGPYKGVLRYHLGLIVPEPREQCRIRVENDISHWGEGQSLIFDDSYEHEVWNDTESRRVVLFIDFIRPLPFPLSTINRQIIKLIALSSFVQVGKQNLNAWEKAIN